MITSFPQTNKTSYFGGVRKILFIPVEDILAEPEIFEGKVLSNYLLKPTKQYLEAFFNYENAKLDIADNSNTKGMLTKSTLTAFISGGAAQFDELFCEMRCKRFIVFVVDKDKNVRVLGRTNNGCAFQFNYSTEKKHEDAPGYEYKFTYETSCVPPTTTEITDIC